MPELYEYGYLGLFLACFLAATVLPFSSEAVVLFFAYAGYDITTIVIVATLGNWLGGISSYWLGYLGKWEWIERLLRIKKEKAQRTKNYLQSKGNIMAFFAFLPLVGDIIPLALGLLRTNFYVMAVIMALGKLFRYVVWVFLVMKMV